MPASDALVGLGLKPSPYSELSTKYSELSFENDELRAKYKEVDDAFVTATRLKETAELANMRLREVVDFLERSILQQQGEHECLISRIKELAGPYWTPDDC